MSRKVGTNSEQGYEGGAGTHAGRYERARAMGEGEWGRVQNTAHEVGRPVAPPQY